MTDAGVPGDGTRRGRLDGDWRKSRRSGISGDCVEARVMDGSVELRDSRHPDGPVLRFSSDAWAAFVRAVAGEGSQLI